MLFADEEFIGLYSNQFFEAMIKMRLVVEIGTIGYFFEGGKLFHIHQIYHIMQLQDF